MNNEYKIRMIKVHSIHKKQMQNPFGAGAHKVLKTLLDTVKIYLFYSVIVLLLCFHAFSMNMPKCLLI